MTAGRIRILLVEQNEDDYQQIRRLLVAAGGGAFDLQRESGMTSGIDALGQERFDICLAGCPMPDGGGIAFLREARARKLRVPIILLAAEPDYRSDVEAMRAGVSDYLVKRDLTPETLERAVRYAMDRFGTIEAIRRAHDELRTSELRFRCVVQTANDAIVLADSAANIILWNTSAERIFGYSEDEILGRPLEQLLAGQHRDIYRAGFERFRLTGKSGIMGKSEETEGMRSDGSVFPMELSLASWSTHEGTFFTAIIRDVAERRAAAELRLAKDAAETANRAKSEFVVRMSHDLRTPLSAIMGFAQILLQNREGNLGWRDRDYIQRIMANARDQLNLINTLLDLSKIETGRMDLNIQEVSLDVLISDIVRQMESRLSGKVTLRVEVPPGLAPVSTDEARLKQVLMNLLDHALKTTDSGSVLFRVHSHAVDKRPVQIDIIAGDSEMPFENSAENVERSLRGAEQNAAAAAGGGLGLTISRSLCERMGHQLNALAPEGRGAAFRIVLNTNVHHWPLTA